MSKKLRKKDGATAMIDRPTHEKLSKIKNITGISIKALIRTMTDERYESTIKTQ